MNKIVVNFGDLTNELKSKGLRIFIRKTYNTSMFIQDNKDNVYQIENYWVGSYLDKLIKNKTVVEFYQVDYNIVKEWEKDIYNSKDIESFIKRQKL